MPNVTQGDWVWKAATGMEPSEMNRRAKEALGKLSESRIVSDDAVSDAAASATANLPNWLESEIAIESIAVADGAITLEVVIPDRREEIRPGEMVYDSVWMRIGRSEECPPGWLRVELGKAVWIQTCTNEAGYWTTSMCVSPDWSKVATPGPGSTRTRRMDMNTRSAGSDAPGSPGPEHRVADDPGSPRPGGFRIDSELRSVLDRPSLIARLRESMGRGIWNMLAGLGLVSDAYMLNPEARTRVWELLLSTYPGNTEFDLIMALSEAANADGLPVETRLLLQAAAGEVLKTGLWQCVGMGTSVYSPHGYPGGGENFDASAQSVAPDHLLDAMDALLAPYEGETSASLGDRHEESLHALNLGHLWAQVRQLLRDASGTAKMSIQLSWVNGKLHREDGPAVEIRMATNEPAHSDCDPEDGYIER